MSDRNAYQLAVEELEALVGPHYVRIIPSEKVHMAKEPTLIQIPSKGLEVKGENLADALAKMKAAIAAK